MKYSIVIVTFNRCSLLKECIECALRQTRPADHIVVVNNASTDETGAYLDTLSDSRLVIHHMQENAGGAGGFYTGLQISHRLGDDCHIIIDDDAMLAEDFAEILCQKAEAYPQIMAFAGSVVTNGEIVPDHRQYVKRPGYRMKKVDVAEYKKASFYCDTASFCGLMIRDEVIAAAGLPEKDYFIWYDDTEYCLRLRKLSEILVVPKARLNHKTADAKKEWPRHYTWKDYYGIRNRIHMVKKHGNMLDSIVLRIDLWINSGLRNRIFHILRFHKESWKNEVTIYKKGIRDAKRFMKEK